MCIKQLVPYVLDPSLLEKFVRVKDSEDLLQFSELLIVEVGKSFANVVSFLLFVFQIGS